MLNHALPGNALLGQVLLDITSPPGLILINSDGTVTIELLRLTFGDTIEDLREEVIHNDYVVHDSSWKNYSNYNLAFELQPESVVEAVKDFAFDERGKVVRLQVPDVVTYHGLFDADTLQVVRVNELANCPENYEADINFNFFVLQEDLLSPSCL